MSEKRVFVYSSQGKPEERGIEICFENIRRAAECGATGVIIAGRKMDDIVYAYKKARERFPETQIGISLEEGREPEKLNLIARECVGLNILYLDRLPAKTIDGPPKLEIWGSVLFKGLPTERLLAGSGDSRKNVTAVSVGDLKDGTIPNLQAAKRIRELVGRLTGMAIAGNLSPETISHLLPVADDFIVGRTVFDKDVTNGGLLLISKEKLLPIVGAVSTG